jgi:hypothetical protein
MNLNNNLVACVMVCDRTLVAVIAAVLLSLPNSASAQPVYFEDDFDGNALKPHWIQPPPEHWEYDVSGGMLNVTALKYPSLPKTGFNFVDIWAPLDQPATGDFEAEVAMTIEPQLPSQAYRIISFVLSPEPPGVQSDQSIFAYYNEFGNNQASWGMSSNGQFAQSPSFANPGSLILEIARNSSEVSYSMNGSLLAKLPATANLTIESLAIRFIAAWPDAQFEPIRIDRVNIIPTPAVGACLIAGLGFIQRRRR